MNKVAVITRTKNRGVMLERAMQSVARQRFKDFVWVVVNDGGDREEVDRILERWPHRDIPVVVVHHPTSKGMEAASNAGIAASASEYIVIHDDDDTWDPEFLLKTAGFMDSSGAKDCVGVITDTVRVDEVLDGLNVRETARRRWTPNTAGYPVGRVQFADITVENQFAPIAFLFRRSAYGQVGGYDEGLPVLGDWDFNLKVLCLGDIAVIPEMLANYHHRPAVAGSSYGNSVHAGVNKHVVYDAAVRNRIIRNAMSAGNPTLALLVANGRNRLALSGAIGYSSALLLAKRVAKKLLRR